MSIYIVRNEEAGTHQHSFHLHVQVQRELDAKIICVSEDFLQKAAPLLADATNGCATIFPLQLQNNNNTSVRHKLLILSHTLSLNNGNNISLAADLFKIFLPSC